MGDVAVRAGKKLDFDRKTTTVANVHEAGRFIKPVYRENRTLSILSALSAPRVLSARRNI
jgi:hypothetical protein